MLVKLSPLESSSNTWQVNHTEWPSDATAHPHASTVNLTLRALVTAHAFPGAARSCHFMQQRERERCHCKPPHLPLLLIRTVCADALKKKMSAYLPRRCVSPHHLLLLLRLLLLLLHSSPSLFQIYTFLALLAARQEDIDCPSINFHSRAPLENWLHFGGDCCKVQAGDNLIAQLLSKLKRRAI